MLTKISIQLVVMGLLVLATCLAFGQSNKPVFACSMGKLSSAQREELKAAVHRLIAAKPVTKELTNGYQMTFDCCDLCDDATTWIRHERICCEFFSFDLALSPNNGPMTIRLTGPKGVKAFIDEDLPAIKTLTHNK